MQNPTTYDPDILPQGVRSRILSDINGLDMHVLEAGFEGQNKPCLILLHGFPELAYSWRKIMGPLADAGYHVVAPDQRGYGRTVFTDGGWDGDYDGDLGSFRFLNLVRDVLGLVEALGLKSVAGVIGHDFGSPVAAYCALIRGDVFRSVALMSGPFAGPPAISDRAPTPDSDIHADLAALARPRKHYQWYYSTREANDDMVNCPQGVHDFLRAYYHHKSADWAGNQPTSLASWTAPELAKMPTYYIMELDQTMPETVAAEMPDAAEIAACTWLTDDELAVYAGEFSRSGVQGGFQGGLQWYRCRTQGPYEGQLQIFSGRTIDVPACFIGGGSDWGIRQVPGALEKMQAEACSNMAAVHIVPGAGHWVQQEQPEAVSAILLDFLA
ncbi:MAG: alpha/beta hydrolase [Alphaproteobacteria bacterium]|nr:alpha/beta hydrolase [Alphaproteobacteria bacterium]